MPIRLIVLKARRKCRDSRKACTARTERLQTEEGLELVLFVENPDGGAEEDKEDKEKDTLAPGRASFLHGDCGALQGGESGGVFLNLGFGKAETRCILAALILVGAKFNKRGIDE